MIRILHILHSMNRGGTEAMLMNLYRHIDREQIQFDFLLTDPAPCAYEPEIGSLGGRVYRIPRLTRGNPLRYMRAADAFFKAHPEYRIVHSHTSSKSAIPLWIARRNGIPVRICHSHSNRSESGINGLIRDALKPALRHMATDLFACSDAGAQWLYGTRTVRKGGVHIVKNAIPCADYAYDGSVRQEVRERLGLGDALVIGHTGRFHPAKNHLFLLDIFSEIRRRRPDARLLLVGDGALRPQIQRRIAELGLADAVVLTGVVSDVHRYMQAMDVFVFPSHYEGLGMVLVEAQAAGLRCFTSAGSVPEEANVAGLVEYIPLSESPAVWAERVLRHTGPHPRTGTLEKIRAKGYDIAEAARRLEAFYLRRAAEISR